MDKPYKRRFLPVLDKRFQYKYTAMIVGVAAVVSAVLGYFLLQTYWELNRIMDLALDAPEISARIDGQQAARMFYIAMTFLALEIVILGGIGLLITHRLCGPVFVMHQYLATLLHGRYPEPRSLRSGDEFADTFAVLTEVINSLKKRDANEIEQLTEALDTARKQGNAESGVAVLQRLIDERSRRLGHSAVKPLEYAA